MSKNKKIKTKTTKMKTLTMKQIVCMMISAAVMLCTMSCSKSADKPGGGIAIKDYGTHNIDPQLQGQWMWTSGSDIGNYDENGTWQGSGYGFAWRLAVDGKGNGTLFSHIFVDGGSYFGVDIYYNGYYEMDADNNLTFYPMEGRYTNSKGTNRPLNADEVYNTSTHAGRTIPFPQVQFKTQAGREAFTTTTDNDEEVFFKQ